MLMITYISFILCFIADIILIISESTFASIYSNPSVCTSCNSTDVYEYSQAYYNTLGVITVGLSCRLNNFTGLVNWTQGSKPDVCSPVKLMYDLYLWACLKPYGCQNFSSSDAINPNDPNNWSFMYSDIAHPLETDMCTLNKHGYYLWDFTGSTYINDVSDRKRSVC